jgi:tight adherence protein C
MLNNLLDAMGINLEDGLRLGFFALIFLAVIFAVYGVNVLLFSSDVARRRVVGEASPVPTGPAPRESLSYRDEIAKASPLMAPIVRRLVPTDMKKISLLRRRLVRAGYHQPSAIGFFYVARIGLAAIFIALLAVAAPVLATRLPEQMLPLIGLAGIASAFYFPDIWIAMRTRSLQRQFRDGFPDALDLLVVCVEAGLSLDAAISRVGQEIGRAHPALSDNFALMSLELRAGGSRADALHNLAERMGIDEVRSMVTLLLQSEELGTSIADALRVYSDDMRTMRMLRAEEKAQSLPVKLALPLGFFVFPTMMIVILLPVMIRIFRVILQK